MSIDSHTVALRTGLAALLLLGATLARADGIAIQNANYDATGRQVIVKGKIDGFAGAQNVSVRNLATGAVLGTQSTSKQFSFFFPVPEGTTAPCEVQVRVGTEVKSAEVRHGPGLCARYTVQLTGTVTDGPIANALVTVTIDGITYTTTADANGNYTLPITTANLNQLLKIEAAGTSESGTPIEFTNLIGTFSRVLDEQTTTGSAKGNVTNTTTASYVLVLQANDGVEPTTEEQLRTAETSVDATELLKLAAIIKLIVDEGYDLPPGETNLIEFISDPAAVEQYVATTLSTPQAQADLATVVDAILADSNLVAGFTAQDIPERYFAIPAAQPGYMARSGYILEFDAAGAGTGRVLDYSSGFGQKTDLPFNWQISSGRLSVQFAQPVVQSYFETANNLAGILTPAEQAALDGQQIPVTQRVYGYTYTRLNDGVLADPVLRDAVYTLQVLPFGSFVPTNGGEVSLTSENTETFRSSLDIQPIPFVGSCPGPAKSVCVPGTWGSLAMYSPGIDAGFITGAGGTPIPLAAWGDVQSFVGTGSGTATGVISGVTANWSVGADGALTVTYPSGWVQRMTIIENVGLEYGVFHEFSKGTERFATYSINVKADSAFSFTSAYLANAAGEIWNGEINSWFPSNWNADGTRPLRGYFGWRFSAADNSALNLNRIAPNRICDGDGIADDLYASVSIGTRSIAGDGRVIIDRRGNGTVLRTWYPIASTLVGGDRQFYVLEFEKQGNGNVRIAGRINLLREIPVPQWKCSGP